jgi:hypothetical protein
MEELARAALRLLALIIQDIVCASARGIKHEQAGWPALSMPVLLVNRNSYKMFFSRSFLNMILIKMSKLFLVKWDYHLIAVFELQYVETRAY